jgi:hypothetical protein
MRARSSRTLNGSQYSRLRLAQLFSVKNVDSTLTCDVLLNFGGSEEKYLCGVLEALNSSPVRRTCSETGVSQFLSPSRLASSASSAKSCNSSKNSPD